MKEMQLNTLSCIVGLPISTLVYCSPKQPVMPSLPFLIFKLATEFMWEISQVTQE